MRSSAATVPVLFVSCLAACTTAPQSMPDAGPALGPDEIPLKIDLQCPGAPACADNQGPLLAAAAKREITPLVEPFTDTNGNGYWDEGEPFTDMNGNNQFDPVWMGGFGSGHLARGVHDPTWVRCYVLRQGQTTLAQCVIDTAGYFVTEVQKIRQMLDPSLGIDLLLISATHDHETQDTLGIFGPDDTTTGIDPAFMARIRAAAVAALTEAIGNLKPAKLTAASIPVEDPGHDMTHLVSDLRDPVIIDNVLHLLQFDGAADGKPIVTLVNWTGHVQGFWKGKRLISSDYVHYLRLSVEKATGCDVVYITGAAGGQIGNELIKPIAADGTVLPTVFDKDPDEKYIEAWGESVAAFALKAFAARQEIPTPSLSFAHTGFAVHIENPSYHAAFFLHLFDRPLYGYDPKRALVNDATGDNTPLTDTEVAYVRLGSVSMLTAPGELFPESFIGGYDGSRRGTWDPFIDFTKIAPADVTKAPRPPYLYDRMGGDPAHRLISGYTLDMLGYFVPRYNFYVDPTSPYVYEPPGDNHYEETNSIGPRAEAEIIGTMRQLVMAVEGEK